MKTAGPMARARLAIALAFLAAVIGIGYAVRPSTHAASGPAAGAGDRSTGWPTPSTPPSAPAVPSGPIQPEVLHYIWRTSISGAIDALRNDHKDGHDPRATREPDAGAEAAADPA